jgi:1,4-alpha-glucan branching enzyme
MFEVDFRLFASLHVPKRRGPAEGEYLITVCNFTPQPHSNYRVGVPELGFYEEIFNSDAGQYGGSNMGNLGGKWAEEWGYHHKPYSLDLCLPPLGILVFKIDRAKTAAAMAKTEDVTVDATASTLES